MFARLGSWCFRKRRRVAVLWVAAIIVVGGASSAVGGNFGQEFEPPGFESTRGIDILENDFPDQVGSGMSGTIVFRAEQGVDDLTVQATMGRTFEMIQALADRSANGSGMFAHARGEDQRLQPAERGRQRPYGLAHPMAVDVQRQPRLLIARVSRRDYLTHVR